MQALILLCICFAAVFAAPDTSCSSQVRELEAEMEILREQFGEIMEDMSMMKAVVEEEGKSS
jgi:hypothetical protein